MGAAAGLLAAGLWQAVPDAGSVPNASPPLLLLWGAIVVAAVTGSVAYALLVQLERRVAFWHPSIRSP